MRASLTGRCVRGGLAICLVLLLALVERPLPATAQGTGPPGGRVRWKHLSSKQGDLPSPGPSTQQTGTVVADIDGNGVNDFVLSFREKAPALVWYRRTRSKWDRHVIEPEYLTVEAGGAVHDIDGDGDLDLVFGADYQGNQVWWWENPAPRFDPARAWTRRVIKGSGKTQHHDQAFGDFLGTGKPQLVFWNQGDSRLFLAEIPADPRHHGPWTLIPIHRAEPGAKGPPYLEGLAAEDIDGDGRREILAGNGWLKHLGGHRFSFTSIGEHGGRIAAERFRPGKVPQVVIAPGDGIGPLMLYECRGTPSDPKDWSGRSLLDRPMVHGHTLELADVDGDGNLDIFTAEMARWKERNPDLDHPGATAWILYGDGRGQFEAEVLARGIDFHEARAADLDGDGDVDILDKPYTWEAPRVDVWLNLGR